MPPSPRTSLPHIALLRGVNVGGKNSLPMKALAAMFAETGCEGVQTYIQSGNVVFGATPALAKKIPAMIEAEIEERFKIKSPVIVRSGAELRAAVAANPFLKEGGDAATLHVAFLAETPSGARAASLDPDRSPPDRFALIGREVFLHLPNGVGKTKLTNAYLDSKLGTVSTIRNWRTVLKLLELAGA